MAEKRGTLAVLTGGGDCPGLNAVIRAVVKTAVTHGYEIYGIRNGFHGLIQDDMKKCPWRMYRVSCRAAGRYLVQQTGIIPSIMRLVKMQQAMSFMRTGAMMS